jgi:hypothetical protein
MYRSPPKPSLGLDCGYSADSIRATFITTAFEKSLRTPRKPPIIVIRDDQAL